jgi:hypothetical protein
MVFMIFSCYQCFSDISLLVFFISGFFAFYNLENLFFAENCLIFMTAQNMLLHVCFLGKCSSAELTYKGLKTAVKPNMVFQIMAEFSPKN